ncbi:SRPBCC family protein [Hoeflea sp.]|uniref:SRPBCC family protein n=1 Tax=Hoeflea sp. TaxID=1940281 RepID=UPI003B013226
MIHHERTLVIDAEPDAVWAVIGRFMHIDEFAPMVTSVDALTNGADGMGSKRRCLFENGSSMVEEVIGWEPERGYRVLLSDMDPMPLEEAQAEIAVAPTKNGQTKVTWSMDYRVKYGPLGWLLGQTMMKMMMGKVLDGNLKGLADKVLSSQRAAAQSSQKINEEPASVMS